MGMEGEAGPRSRPVHSPRRRKRIQPATHRPSAPTSRRRPHPQTTHRSMLPGQPADSEAICLHNSPTRGFRRTANLSVPRRLFPPQRHARASVRGGGRLPSAHTPGKDDAARGDQDSDGHQGGPDLCFSFREDAFAPLWDLKRPRFVTPNLQAPLVSRRVPKVERGQPTAASSALTPASYTWKPIRHPFHDLFKNLPSLPVRKSGSPQLPEHPLTSILSPP